MSALLLLRKASSSSSLFHRRLVITASAHFFSSPLQPPSSSSSLSSFSSVASKHDWQVYGVDNLRNSLDGRFSELRKWDKFRAFHSGRVLEATGYAVADLSDDDKKGATDEGLDISKLGISNDIVSSLARRGITKLFPIQVYLLFFN